MTHPRALLLQAALLTGSLCGSPLQAQDSAPTFEPVREIAMFDGDGWNMDMSADGKRLVMSGSNKDDKPGVIWAVVYDVVKDKPLYKFESFSGGYIPVAISRDGKFVAYRLSGNVIQVVDVASGRELGQLRDQELSSGYSGLIHFSPDGNSLWTYFEGPERRPGRVLSWIRGTPGPTLYAEGLTPTSMSLFEDGRRAAVGYRNGEIRIWDLKSGKATALVTGKLPEPGSGDLKPDEIQAIEASHDGKYLVSGVTNKHPQLWDVASGKVIRELTTYGQPRNDLLVFDPQNRVVLCQGTWLLPDGKQDYRADGRPIHVFDLKSGRRLAYLNIPGTGLSTSIAWSARWGDGGRRLYVSVSNGKIKVFDAEPWLKEVGKAGE